MTDEEIFDLMYEHADAFSSCVQFSEQGVLNFARAVLDHVKTATDFARSPEPGYIDELWSFTETVDQFKSQQKDT